MVFKLRALFRLECFVANISSYVDRYASHLKNSILFELIFITVTIFNVDDKKSQFRRFVVKSAPQALF